MNFRPTVNMLVGLVLMSLSYSVFAGDVPRIHFSIKPNLCILSNGEEICHDELNIQWQSDERLSLCLYQSNRTNPLHCWEGQFAGVHNTVISTEKNIEFELRGVSEKDLLITDSFEVVHDDSKFRRRRRNAWSFF